MNRARVVKLVTVAVENPGYKGHTGTQQDVELPS